MSKVSILQISILRWRLFYSVITLLLNTNSLTRVASIKMYGCVRAAFGNRPIALAMSGKTSQLRLLPWQLLRNREE
jgi:hypothetical protein